MNNIAKNKIKKLKSFPAKPKDLKPIPRLVKVKIYEVELMDVSSEEYD